MSVRMPTCFTVFALLALMVLVAGCTSPGVGDVSYHNGSVWVTITSPSGPADAYVQVTVHQLKDFHQTEVAFFETPVTLVQGENVISVPGEIPPGNYKTYVYVIQNNERRTAVIRDIEV
ncbi:hypothetical protein [Methanoregula sp.]|uniref:hypothetical protein n=1 Tax=Methanoregula sp. TaxID=2052170 RepID=UPI003568A0EF